MGWRFLGWSLVIPAIIGLIYQAVTLDFSDAFWGSIVLLVLGLLMLWADRLRRAI